METMYNIHVAVLEIIHNLDIFPLIVNINEHSNTGNYRSVCVKHIMMLAKIQ